MLHFYKMSIFLYRIFCYFVYEVTGKSSHDSNTSNYLIIHTCWWCPDRDSFCSFYPLHGVALELKKCHKICTTFTTNIFIVTHQLAFIHEHNIKHYLILITNLYLKLEVCPQFWWQICLPVTNSVDFHWKTSKTRQHLISSVDNRYSQLNQSQRKWVSNLCHAYEHSHTHSGQLFTRNTLM